MSKLPEEISTTRVSVKVRYGGFLVQSSFNRWDFKYAKLDYLLPVIFLGISGFFLWAALFVAHGVGALFPLVYGVLLIFLGAFIIYRGYKNRVTLDFVDFVVVKNRKNLAKLNDICAVQIVQKYINKRVCYELNLVRENGNRLNICDYYSRSKVLSDGRAIAEKLGIALLETISQKKYKNPPQVLLILGLVFSVLGAVIFYFVTIAPCIKSVESRHWVETPAVVTHSELVRKTTTRSKGGTSTTCRIAITYLYSYQNATYAGERYDASRSSFSTNIGVGEMSQIVRNHPVGKKIFCYVNPYNPQEALINRQIPTSFWYIQSWFGIIFLSAGLAVFNLGRRSL